MKDLRIIFTPTHIVDNKYGNRYVALSENILVYHSGNTYDYIPIDEATFTYGGEYLSDYGKVHFEDILRYKLNKKKNVHTNEIYYDKCKNILTSTDELKASYNNGTPRSLSDYYLGSRRYTKRGIVTTILKDDTADFLVCEVKNENGSVISSQTFNDNLDVISQTVDAATISYTRQNGLVTEESVIDSLNNNLYTRTTSYSVNASGCPIITTIDEFNNTTVYTLDSVWGNVKSVTLPGGQVVTDEYDADACAKLKRTFISGGRSNIYEYFGGNLSRVQGNGIYYDFAYSGGDLSSIKKNNVLIEEHEITNTQTDSYYPSKSGAIYSNKATLDKYGRLTNVSDVLTNTYRVETVVLLSHKKPDGHINVKVEFGEGEGKVPLDNIAKRAEEYKPKERVTYKMIKEYIEAKYGFKVHTAYIAEVKRDLGLPMYDAPNAVEELKQPRKHPTAEKVEAIKDALKHFEVI